MDLSFYSGLHRIEDEIDRADTLCSNGRHSRHSSGVEVATRLALNTHLNSMRLPGDTSGRQLLVLKLQWNNSCC